MRPGRPAGPEDAARAHAARVLARDPRVREDLAPGALLESPDLLARLLARPFRDAELVAHARIGAHHIFKTKPIGPLILVVHARWAADADGTWRIREAELVRVEGPASDPAVAGGHPGATPGAPEADPV